MATTSVQQNAINAAQTALYNAAGVPVASAVLAEVQANLPTTTSTVIAKIKASIAGATNNNSFDIQPWVAPSAWAATTPYGYGQAVTISGLLCINSNTAGGTSGGTTPTIVENGTTDGTCFWVPMGGAPTAFSAYDVPVITFPSSPSLGQTFYSGTTASPGNMPNTGNFRFIGGAPYYNGSSANNIYMRSTYQGGTGGNIAGQGAPGYNQQHTAFELVTDAPKIALNISQGQTAAIGGTFGWEIDGRRYTPGNVSNAAGGGIQWIQFDWTGSAVQQRKPRKIRCRAIASAYPFQVQVDLLSSIWPAQNSNRYRIAFEGDSMCTELTSTSSSSTNLGGIGGTYWTDIFLAKVGCDDWINSAVGGTGFLNTGAYTNYAQRLPWLASFNPDVLVVCGNQNDNSGNGWTSAQRRVAVLGYLAQARAALPNAVIIVFSTWPAGNAGTSDFAISNGDMQYAVQTFNDPLVLFYSLYSDPAGPWATGSGNTSATTGTGNSDLYTSSGPPHPTQRACIYMGNRYATAFSSLINSIIK